MKTQSQINHLQLALKSSYEQFTTNIQKVLNHLETDWAKDLQTDPEGVRKHLQEIAGDTGLMIFGTQEHGQLLKLYGRDQKAIQYTIGNPLTAVEMTKYDIRAGLYAPLRIIIYQSEDGQLYAEYDLPSSLFGQFGNETFIVGKDLDQKLEDVIHQVDHLGI